MILPEPLTEEEEGECDWTGCTVPSRWTLPSFRPWGSEYIADTYWCSNHYLKVLNHTLPPPEHPAH